LVACCQRATDRELEEDPEQYDCSTCEVRLRYEALSEHDQQALQTYELLALGVVQDLRLTNLVFDVAGLRMTRADARSLLLKLDVIHRDAQQARDNPPPAES